VVLLIVWAVVVVLAVVVLGGLVHGLHGALGRLRRELDGAERDLRPLLRQMHAAADRAAQLSERRSTTG
jgi:hypothetical protein